MTDDSGDRLEGLLREDAARAIAEEGFCRRVAAALPPPRASRAWLRPALVVGSAALGGVLAVLAAPAGMPLAQGFADLARLPALTPAALAALGLALAMAVTAGVLVAEES